MFERLMKYLDWVAIPTGLAALICNILLSNEGIEKDISYALCALAAILGGIYIAYAVILWCRKPLFDWHLINGHFLRKVCCLVLLMPSILAFVAVHCVDSSKELTYAEELYECGEKELSCRIKREQESPNIYWSVYYHFIDPGNQHMTTTKRGRAWAACIGILGMFLLNGLLVSSIIGYIDRRKEKWLKGEVRYKCFLKRYPHYVIIGGNDMVPGIVKQFLTKICEDKCFWARFSRPYILVQTSRDVEEFRRELFSTLNEEKQKNIIIYYGSRTSKKDIEELYIESANEVYVLGEETRTDDLESYHDTMNMECLDMITDYYKNTGKGKKITKLNLTIEELNKQIKKTDEANQKKELKKTLEALDGQWKERPQLRCRVMFEYQTTFSVFQFYDVDKEVCKYIDFKPFNYYESWAQKVLVNKEIRPEMLQETAARGDYLPLEGAEGIKINDEKYVHLFVVGMSRMGVAMGIEAAHLAHYPNYENKNVRTKITFIDKNAAEEKNFFMGRFKELFELSHWRYGEVDNNSLAWKKSHTPSDLDYLGGDFLDIEWEFINGGIEHVAIQDYILASANPSAIVTVAVCLPESNRSHAAALYLNKKIYESKSVIQVLVYNRYGDSIMKSLHSNEAKHPYLNKLKSFGTPEACVDVGFLEQSENVGAAIGDKYSEIKRRYIDPAQKEAGLSDGKGGYKGKSSTAKSWSNIYNGNMVWTKLRSINYKGGELSPAEIALLSDVEHNRWNIEQLLLNFRPLTKKEQQEVIDAVLGIPGKIDRKEELKGEMAHLNICSNKRLAKLRHIDVAARAYDEGLTTLLPDIYARLQNNS